MDVYIGTILLFAGNYPPLGWMFCAGQLLSITQNQALFAVLGTMYGGNGTTNFALPDLRGRVPVGVGQGIGLSTVEINQQGGAETVTLTPNQMPIHSHLLNAASTQTSATPIGNLPAPVPGDESNLAAFGSDVAGQMAANAITAAGQGQAHENRQPYLGLNYIIAVQGLFPPHE